MAWLFGPVGHRGFGFPDWLLEMVGQSSIFIYRLVIVCIFSLSQTLEISTTGLEYVYCGAQAQFQKAPGGCLSGSSLSPSGGWPCVSQKKASFGFAIQFHL